MNGYTEIEVSGIKAGLKFGMYSTRLFAEKSAKIELYAGDQLNEMGIAVILHTGYLNNCVVKEVEPQLTFESFVDYVESAITDKSVESEVRRVIDVWLNSRVVKQVIDTESKKKDTTGKKSKK